MIVPSIEGNMACSDATAPAVWFGGLSGRAGTAAKAEVGFDSGPGVASVASVLLETDAAPVEEGGAVADAGGGL